MSTDKSDPLPVPEELQHLIEKRSGAERRGGHAPSADDEPPTNQPAQSDRRVKKRREEDK